MEFTHNFYARDRLLWPGGIPPLTEARSCDYVHKGITPPVVHCIAPSLPELTGINKQ